MNNFLKRILKKKYSRFISKSILSFYLIFFTFLLHAGTQYEQAIQEPINQLHETLINIMVISDTTNFEERYTYLEPVINKNFDIALISKVILGRYWKSIDEEIKVRFINLFNRLTISTYISRFNSYDNRIFKNISIEQLKENRYLVKTEFVRLKEKPISFNYILQKNGKKWRIISVIANGINDLSLKRAEYAVIIKKDGIEVLIKKLEQKIYDLQSN
jgi:phospholipid transport system substrate-binding protein